MGIGYLGMAAIVLGIARHRPQGATAWWLFAVGLFLNSTGTFVEAAEQRWFHHEDWPNAGVWFYFAMFPFLVVGLAMLSWRRIARRDWSSMVDATTIATGI